LDGGTHGTFYEGRRAERDFCGFFRVDEVQGGFCAQNGAAQVHEHQDAFVRVDAFDGFHDVHGIGAQFGVTVPRTTGGGDGDGDLGGHAPGQNRGGFGQGAAVGN
jgi:hypothetical protein